MTTRLLWLGAVAAGVVGTALVFASVTLAGLFLPGVILLDVALLVALAAGVLRVSADRTTPAG